MSTCWAVRTEHAWRPECRCTLELCSYVTRKAFQGLPCWHVHMYVCVCVYIYVYIYDMFIFTHTFTVFGVSLVAQMVENLPAVQKTWVRSLVWEDPLEKEIAAHSSVLAWRIPGAPGRLQSMRLQRVKHDWVTNTFTFVLYFSFCSKIKGMGTSTSCPHIYIASPIINSPQHSGTCVKIYEPTLTHHYHPKSMVYVTVHSWCGPVCVFGQKYNGIYPPLWNHTQYFHCPKNHLCSVRSSLPLH